MVSFIRKQQRSRRQRRQRSQRRNRVQQRSQRRQRIQRRVQRGGDGQGNQGHDVSLPSEYFGINSGAYFPAGSPELGPYQTAYGLSNSVSFGKSTDGYGCDAMGPNLAPGPNSTTIQTGGRRRFRRISRLSRRRSSRRGGSDDPQDGQVGNQQGMFDLDDVQTQTQQGEGVQTQTQQGEGVQTQTQQGDDVQTQTQQGDDVQTQTQQEEGESDQIVNNPPVSEPPASDEEQGGDGEEMLGGSRRRRRQQRRRRTSRRHRRGGMMEGLLAELSQLIVPLGLLGAKELMSKRMKKRTAGK